MLTPPLGCPTPSAVPAALSPGSWIDPCACLVLRELLSAPAPSSLVVWPCQSPFTPPHHQPVPRVPRTAHPSAQQPFPPPGSRGARVPLSRRVPAVTPPPSHSAAARDTKQRGQQDRGAEERGRNAEAALPAG